MPFVGKWSARIRQPGQFDRIRTELDAFGTGIDVIWGIKENKTFVQAIRFDSDKFDKPAVTKWLSEHDDGDTGKPYKVIEIEEPIKEGSMASLDTVIAVYASGLWTPMGEPETLDGVVHQKFRKELMRVGQYKPEGRPAFEVTMEDLNHWVTVSKQMHANGVRIPFSAGPVPHEDVGNPENSIGTMEDEFVEGESLFIVLDIVGEDNIEEALANDVSIYSPVEYKDGEGRSYERPITHVALTPNPLVPGLEGWERIAASLEASNEGKEKGMWKAIAKALGLSTEKMTEENAKDKILAGIKEMKQTHKDEIKEAKKAVKKGSLEEMLEDEDVKAAIDEEIEKQVEAKTVEIKAALSGNKKEVDPQLVDVVADNRELKLKGLFESCRITADVQKDIMSRYGEKDAITASMKIGENGDEFKFWMGILAKNKPVDLVEKSGAQVILASLKDPNTGDKTKDEDNPLLRDATARAEAATK